VQENVFLGGIDRPVPFKIYVLLLFSSLSPWPDARTTPVFLNPLVDTIKPTAARTSQSDRS
jgi:hypothetical protein